MLAGKFMRLHDCRGEFEVDCAGTKEAHGHDICYIVDVKCEGLSWPKFKSCAGLYEAHVEAVGDSKARSRAALQLAVSVAYHGESCT
jgi:hypothetical protein